MFYRTCLWPEFSPSHEELGRMGGKDGQEGEIGLERIQVPGPETPLSWKRN